MIWSTLQETKKFVGLYALLERNNFKLQNFAEHVVFFESHILIPFLRFL